MDPLDWLWRGPSYWFGDATEPIDHPIYVVLALVLAVALIGGIATRLAVHRLFGGHRFKQRRAARAASYAVALAAVGLVILLFRWQPVPLLSKPIWFFLWALAALGGLGYGLYYYRRVYPRRLFEYDENARRRRYIPRPRSRRGR